MSPVFAFSTYSIVHHSGLNSIGKIDSFNPKKAIPLLQDGFF
jgi:hypothetical protein